MKLTAALLLLSLQASATTAAKVSIGGVGDGGWDQVTGGEVRSSKPVTTGRPVGKLAEGEVSLSAQVAAATVTAGGLKGQVLNGWISAAQAAGAGRARSTSSSWMLSFPSTAQALATLSGWVSAAAVSGSIALHLPGGRELQASRCAPDLWTPAASSGATEILLNCAGTVSGGGKSGAAWQLVDAQVRTGQQQPAKEVSLVTSGGGTLVWPGCTLYAWELQQSGATPGLSSYESIRFRCKPPVFPKASRSRGSTVLRPAPPLRR